MRNNFKDISGDHIGYLTVVRYVRTDKERRGATIWLCLCVCGTEKEYTKSSLKRVRSCGCKRNVKPHRLSQDERTFNRVVNHYKQSAKKRGLEWSLSNSEVMALFNLPCTYCGRANAGPVQFTGIDRSNNDKGYTPSNSVPCCKTCNRAKHVLSSEKWNEYLDSVFVTSAVKTGPITKKVWGTETLLCNTDEYCAKYLRVKPGFQCSLHKHAVKREEFLVLQGTVFVEVGDNFVVDDNNCVQFLNVRLMGPGEKQEVLPGTWHRFGSINGALLHETSTHHSDEDVVRLQESRKI